ncbi:MAG TPA: hypothetical protein IAC41_00220, partial [Candidatus Merdenecus merdavium]|nr:hypothetical protein [Candidatus Merdenecus merdavium]
MQEETKSTNNQKKKEKSTKKKKKNSALVGAGKVIRIFMATFTIIIAIATAITVLYYLYTSYEKGPTPDQLVKEYFTLLSEGKYDQMYDYLSDESMSNISRQDYVTRHKNIYTGIKAENLTSNVTEIEDKMNAKIVTFDTSMDTVAGNISFTNRLLVKKNSDNVYKIDWDDHLIFPSLTADAKVQRFDQEPVRGNIYDRNHNAIATWSKCFQVG